MPIPNSRLTLVTLGVYGFDADSFWRALQDAQVDTLCDIRRRRGVRGREYAFANSLRLQAALAERGIRYVYSPTLAPSPGLRSAEHAADEAAGITKRRRTTLSPAFVEAFERECLAQFDPSAWRESLPDDAQVVALLCVERDPEACHRGLVAAWLHKVWQCRVVHLQP